MAAADRLSGLSDDLLDSIISLLPTREAACTAALSGRWRPLWPLTDTLRLDTRCYGDAIHASGVKDRLLRHARAALGFTGRCPIRKLSLFVTGPSAIYCQEVMGTSTWITSTWMRGTDDLLTSLLAAPALRHLEEIRVEVEINRGGVTSTSEQNKEEHSVYNLDLAMLPGHTLRVLDLTCCSLRRSPPGAAAFPRLSALRLYKCMFPTEDLQDMIRAAPSLGSLHIESHHNSLGFSDGPSYRLALRCPSLTALTLVDDGSRKQQRIELDAPCLRAFKYDGHLVEFSMRSTATELARADLALRPTNVPNRCPLNLCFTPLCQILRCIGHAKAISLKAPSIEDVAKALRHEHILTLPRLERLELEGAFEPWSSSREGAAAAMATVLHCCPAIHDLRIRITPHPSANTDREASLPDFDVSMDLFQSRDSEEMVERSKEAVPELPGLTGCRFSCLEKNHLKIVKLEFELNKLDSFEVCLARFFAENCLALEVLEIDDGKDNFLNHIHWMVERWRANALDSAHRAM